MERLDDLRFRAREWREQARESWLWQLIPPSPAAHPVPRFAIVLLVVGAVLILIGSFLPWVATSVPVADFSVDPPAIIGEEHFSDSGLERSGGVITLAYTLVLLVVASYLWRMGLSDWRGIFLPFIVALPLLVAVFEIGDARDVVFRDFEGGPEVGRIDRRVKAGLYVVAVGGGLAVMGGLRVSRAAQQLRKRLDAGDDQARPRRMR